MGALRTSRSLTGAFALALLLGTGLARAGDPPVSQEARAHFRVGVSFLDDPDGARYGDAYREFRSAYALSRSWKILGNIGLTAMKIERDGEAVEAYRQYLVQGGDQIDGA